MLKKRLSKPAGGEGEGFRVGAQIPRYGDAERAVAHHGASTCLGTHKPVRQLCVAEHRFHASDGGARLIQRYTPNIHSVGGAASGHPFSVR